MPLTFLNGARMRGGPVHRPIDGVPLLAAVRTAPLYRFYSIRDEYPGFYPVAAGYAGGHEIFGGAYHVLPWGFCVRCWPASPRNWSRPVELTGTRPSFAMAAGRGAPAQRPLGHHRLRRVARLPRDAQPARRPAGRRPIADLLLLRTQQMVTPDGEGEGCVAVSEGRSRRSSRGRPACRHVVLHRQLPARGVGGGHGVEGYPSPAGLAAAGRATLVPALCRGRPRHAFGVTDEHRYTHVRLTISDSGAGDGPHRCRGPGSSRTPGTISVRPGPPVAAARLDVFPDGGLARLRLGVRPTPPRTGPPRLTGWTCCPHRRPRTSSPPLGFRPQAQAASPPSPGGGPCCRRKPVPA